MASSLLIPNGNMIIINTIVEELNLSLLPIIGEYFVSWKDHSAKSGTNEILTHSSAFNMNLGHCCIKNWNICWKIDWHDSHNIFLTIQHGLFISFIQLKSMQSSEGCNRDKVGIIEELFLSHSLGEGNDFRRWYAINVINKLHEQWCFSWP